MDWLRRWRQDGVLAAVIIATLAIGIGVNLAIFSALEAAVFASLPVPRPNQIYLAQNGTTANPDPRFAYPVFQRLERAWAGRAELAAFTRTAALYTPVPNAPPRPVGAQLVSGTFFTVLGARPWRGRFLRPADNQAPDGAAVAVISYGYWRRHPNARVGSSLIISHVALTIVGVAGPHFYGASKAEAPEVWVPLRLQQRLHYHFNADIDSDRGPYQARAAWPTELSVRWLHVLVRVPRTLALARLEAVGTAVDQRALAPYSGQTSRFRQERVWFVPGSAGLAYLRQRLSQPLWILLAMAGLVLLIVCANVALLLLARALGRQQETAVRLALGAGRWRLAAGDVGACLSLAAIGAVLGLLMAWASRGPLLRLLGSGAAAAALPWSGRLVIAAVVAAIVTGLLAGLAPALRGSRADLVNDLKSGAGGGGGARTLRGRVLVAAQVALSLVLLLGAAWLARSLQKVAGTEAGVSENRVIALRIFPRMDGMPASALPGFERELVSRLGALPGAEGAAVSQCGVMMGCDHTSAVAVTANGHALAEHVDAQEDYITPEFFRVLGMRVIRGRGILPGDGPNTPKVIVVNQRFVREFLHGHDPFRAMVKDDGNVRIVGVVNDVRANGLAKAAPPMIYHPWAQDPVYPRFLAVRAATPAAAAGLAAEIRRSLSVLAPGMPAGTIATLRVHAGEFLRGQRAIAELSGGFAILALLLAGLGLYGIMSFAVTRRTNEIGVRMALGARPPQVRRMVLRQAAGVVLIGMVIGAALAVPAVQALRSQMHGLSPFDPLALAAAAVALLLVAFAAAFWPARRAARLEPWRALRRE